MIPNSDQEQTECKEGKLLSADIVKDDPDSNEDAELAAVKLAIDAIDE